MLPFISLGAAPSVQVGAAKDLEGVFGDHHLLVSVTGSPSFTVQLEGSLDGVNWTSFGQASSGTFSVILAGTLLRYVRANLVSLAGGSSPTVTASIASA